MEVLVPSCEVLALRPAEGRREGQEMKVIHNYEKKNLRKLARNENADCTKCAFAEKVPDIEEGYVYLCHAALYDIKTLSCFVPKPDNQKSELPWYMSIFNPNIFGQGGKE